MNVENKLITIETKFEPGIYAQLFHIFATNKKSGKKVNILVNIDQARTFDDAKRIFIEKYSKDYEQATLMAAKPFNLLYC